MKGKTTVWKAFIVLSLIALLAFTCGCAGQEQATDSGTKVVTDMAGREVVIPKNIDTIVTIGGVPFLNSFIFAIGQGDKIANGLPDSFIQDGKRKYQYVIEPALKNKPMIQPTGGDFNIEELMNLNPDVTFATSMASVEILERNNIPVIYLFGTDAEDMKDVMRVLGEVFDEQDRAERYARYVDETVARPGKVVASLPDDTRPKVLCCSYKGMSASRVWWIEKAGGIDVTKDDCTAASMTFDLEQLLTWDPDVIILSGGPGGGLEEAALVYNDTRLSSLNAVKNGKVYATPMGAHHWVQRTSEQPLMVLWTAKTIYPEQFKDLDMEAEVITFYKEFFNCEITREQAAEILSGTA